MQRNYIKTAILLFVLQCACGTSNKLAINNGCILQYDLVTNQKSLRLEVNMLETKNQWKYKYEIKAEGLTAQINSTHGAVTGATELFHNFNGADKSLNSSTSLRVSDSTFKMLLNGDSTEISYRIGFVKNTFKYRVVEKQKIKVLINGKLKPLEVIYVEDLSDKGLALWIWNNPAAPIIFRHNLGFDMVISQMQIP